MGVSANRSDDLLDRNGLDSGIRRRHSHVAGVCWAGSPKLGLTGTENYDNWNPQRRRNVHGATIVTEQEGEAPDQSAKLSHR